MKRLFLLLMILISVTANADPLWEKAIQVYGKHLSNKPVLKKAYLLLESSIPGGQSNKNEVWEEYKVENGNQFRKVIKVAKNGVEAPIPEEAKTKWFPVDQKKPDKKKDYNGLDEIFYADKQQNVTYKSTGKTKEFEGKKCQEYSFSYKKTHRKKPETVNGLTYLDEATGAPYQIRRHNNSAFMKGSPDSFITFSYDGKYLYTKHVMLIMNLNFFGQKKNLKTEVKMEYFN